MVTGTKIINGNGTMAVPFMGDAEYKSLVGHSFDITGDSCYAMNADSSATGLGVYCVIYIPSQKTLQVHLSGTLAKGQAMRINYLIPKRW